MKDILMGIEVSRFLVLVFGLFMQCAQPLELMAKENSKLSLRRSKVFKKKTVEYLRATPLALLPLLLKMSDRLVLIVCVMFKNQDFLCNDLESIYVLNKLRGSQVYHFYRYLSPSLKKVFSLLLTCFRLSTDPQISFGHQRRFTQEPQSFLSM